jgi:hypothetical protein
LKVVPQSGQRIDLFVKLTGWPPLLRIVGYSRGHPGLE